MTGDKQTLAPTRRSESWAVEAERRVVCGRPAAARRCYGRAADWERRTFAALPPGRPRTRGIVGLSAYWLLVKAGRTDVAARQGGRAADS